MQASSESLSHAAVYRSDPAVRAVIHVHHSGLWNWLHERSPGTDPRAEAGTPAMAWAVEALFHGGLLRTAGLFVMRGHRDGLVTFGTGIEEAEGLLLEALDRFGSRSGAGKGPA